MCSTHRTHIIKSPVKCPLILFYVSFLLYLWIVRCSFLLFLVCFIIHFENYSVLIQITVDSKLFIWEWILHFYIYINVFQFFSFIFPCSIQIKFENKNKIKMKPIKQSEKQLEEVHIGSDEIFWFICESCNCLLLVDPWCSSCRPPALFAQCSLQYIHSTSVDCSS